MRAARQIIRHRETLKLIVGSMVIALLGMMQASSWQYAKDTPFTEQSELH